MCLQEPVMAEKKSTETKTKGKGATVGSMSIMTGAKASAGDHFIPIRQAELVDLLAGQPDLKAQDVDLFRRLAQILSATVHHEYQQELEALKTDYASFDPDSDTVPVAVTTAAGRAARLDGLFDRLAKLLERANFTYLSRDALEQALSCASQWGLNLTVDFEVFDRLEIYVRGQGIERRQVRSLSTRFRKIESDAETFQRLVVMLKLRPHRLLPKGVDNDDVYLKLFKDIPRMDLEMLLPGTQIKMSLFDRTKIVVPTASGVAMTGGKLIAGIFAAAGRRCLQLVDFARTRQWHDRLWLAIVPRLHANQGTLSTQPDRKPVLQESGQQCRGADAVDRRG